MPDERPQHVSTIHVWDDPDSKIQFLERTLHGKDWRTTIIYPDKDAGSIAKRAATKASLEAKGYLVKEDIDDCGHATLHVHHIGDGTNLFELYKETGLVKGTMHAGGHPTTTLRYLIRSYQKGIDAIGDALGDPARANGFIYLAAEGFLLFTGLGDKTKTAEKKTFFQSIREMTPRNWLLTGFGAFAFTQSALYLAVSKTNDELSIEHLEKKLKHAKQHGGDITHIKYDAEQDKEPHGAGHAFVRFLRKYPIEIGAAFNDLAMACYGMAAFLRLNETKAALADTKFAGLKLDPLKDLHKSFSKTNKNLSPKALEEGLERVLGKVGKEFVELHGYKNKGFYIDVVRALVSITAWSFLLIPPKKHEEKDNESMLGKAWGKLREDPQIGAGIGTLMSSSLGMWGAAERKNAIQSIGEKIYLFGDFMLFFTNGSEYGGGKEQDLGKLGEKIAKYLHHLPIVLGPDTRREFIHDVAQYLIEKDLATKQKTPISRTEVDERVEILSRGIRKYVETHNPHLDQIAEAVGDIASHFPKEMRPSIINNVAHAVSKLRGVYATPEELQKAIENSVSMAASTSVMRQSKLVQMKDIGKDVAALAFAIPGLDAGASASAIYDTLLPFTRAHTSDKQTLDAAMIAKAAENLGIPAHEIHGTSRGAHVPGDHTR